MVQSGKGRSKEENGTGRQGEGGLESGAGGQAKGQGEGWVVHGAKQSVGGK